MRASCRRFVAGRSFFVHLTAKQLPMFRTEVHVPENNLQLGLHSKVITMGSCFADVIGSKLQQYKVDTLKNPFGTIFNPVSVALLLKAAGGHNHDFSRHLVQHNGIWHAYDLHSSLSSPNQDALLASINERLQQARQYLQESSLLIITLGTAVAYKLLQTGQVVANCHKVPSSQFERVMLRTNELREACEELYLSLKQLNPKLRVLFTVSPVRHVKETLPTNAVSKATLRVLCHELQEAHPELLYFPAYEIMLDDLRDYRFYKEDMLHPTSLAEDYIWQKFVVAYFSTDFKQFIPKWDKMLRALEHRPFHPETAQHQQFLRKSLEQLSQLAQDYSLEVGHEREVLQAQLLP